MESDQGRSAPSRTGLQSTLKSNTEQEDCNCLLAIAEELLEKRMWVELDNYNTLHACVQNDAAAVCKLRMRRVREAQRAAKEAEKDSASAG